MTNAVVTVAGFMLAIVGAYALWLRRTSGTTPADAIRIVTSRHLGPKQQVTLIEVDGERLLVGVTGDAISLVARLSPTPSAEGARAPGGAAPSDYRGATAAPPGALAPPAPSSPER